MTDYENFDENFGEISQEILGLAGIHFALKNAPTEKDIVIEFENGQRMMGLKRFYDENTGIISMIIPIEIPEVKESKIKSLDGAEPQITMNRVLVEMKYRTNVIRGVGRVVYERDKK